MNNENYYNKAVKVFDKLSDVYEQKYMNVDLYENALNLFCSNLPLEGAHILELACGPGNISKYIIERRPDFRYTGTDLSENMIERARKNNPTASFEVFNALDIASYKTTINGLIIGFLFPYLSKEQVINILTQATQKINKDGIIYISTIQGNYVDSGLKKGSTGDEIFMYYHNAFYITEVLKKNGFSILHECQIENLNDTDLVILAKKN